MVRAGKFFLFHFFLSFVVLSAGLGYSLLDVTQTQQAVLDRELASVARHLASQAHSLDEAEALMQKFQVERQTEAFLIQGAVGDSAQNPDQRGRILKRTSGVPFAEQEQIPHTLRPAASQNRDLAEAPEFTVELLSLLPHRAPARAVRVPLSLKTGSGEPAAAELFVYTQRPYFGPLQEIMELPGLPIRWVYVVAVSLIFALFNWLGFHALVEFREDEI